MSKIIACNAGEFRQVHARLRENAEPVAFFGGIVKEGAGVTARFLELVRHRMRMLRTQLRHSVVQVITRPTLKCNANIMCAMCKAAAACIGPVEPGNEPVEVPPRVRCAQLRPLQNL